jgi:hypothetical protein
MPDVICNIMRRNVPLTTFMDGMSFASSGFSGCDGYYFAKGAQDGLVVIDPWLRGATGRMQTSSYWAWRVSAKAPPPRVSSSPNT